MRSSPVFFNKQALGAKYEEFAVASAVRRAEMLGELSGEAVVGMIGGKGVGLAAKPAARAARAAAVLSREELAKVAVVLGHVMERGKKAAGELVPEVGMTPEGFPLAVPLQAADDGVEAAK